MNVRKKLNRVTAFLAATLYLAVAAHGSDAADTFVVTFRLQKAKNAHFDDAKSAQALATTVKKLGGQAKQGSHGGHFDVSYVCPTWKAVSLETHDEAHQWAHWLKANAFETVFVEPPNSGHLATVAFRLPRGKSAHFDAAAKAKAEFETLKMLGCEVKQGSHAGHYDVSYRCTKWRTIGLEGEKDAHKWEKWLKSKGFETRHEHNKLRSASTAGTKR